MTPRARRPARPQRVAALVEEMGPPVSSVAWSSRFVAQTLEILAVCMRGGELFWLKPAHADSLRVGLAPSAKPGQVVLDVLNWYPLQPLVVHSTSWRHADDRIVLTYAAAVDPPEKLPPGSLDELPVKRAEIARGGATAPPSAIEVSSVLEHALRHLSWLVRDDPAIAEALASWRQALGEFQPEPFRALG